MATWEQPEEHRPLIFEASKRNSWKVKEALCDDAWITKINLMTTFTMDHLWQFLALWIALRDLCELVEDSVSWKHTTNGEYSAPSAYNAQFLAITPTDMCKVLWGLGATECISLFGLPSKT